MYSAALSWWSVLSWCDWTVLFVGFSYSRRPVHRCYRWRSATCRYVAATHHQCLWSWLCREQWHAGWHLEWGEGGGYWLDDGYTALLFLRRFNSKHLKWIVTLRVFWKSFLSVVKLVKSGEGGVLLQCLAPWLALNLERVGCYCRVCLRD